MTATKATEQRQQTQSQTPQAQMGGLDNRYGKIGISAVAAAVRHQDKRAEIAPPKPFIQNDSD